MGATQNADLLRWGWGDVTFGAGLTVALPRR